MPWKQASVQMQDRTAHVIVDDRFASMAPVQELPFLNWFGLWFLESADEDEYVPQAETQLFETIERDLIKVAGNQSKGWAVYCIRLMSRGLVEYFLYSKDTSTLAGVVNEIKRLHPSYRLEHECKHDSRWAEYTKYLKAVQ